MAYETIILEKHGAVAVIKFNRPKALNAINPQVNADVHRALDEIEKDSSTRVLVFTGEGEKAFIAGLFAHMSKLSPWKQSGERKGMLSVCL
jgi:enoyl-CoA hydratase/carnithine racemase